LTHSLRKYFDTECRKAGVYPDIVDLLMGHKLSGTKKYYFIPDISTLLEGTPDCKGYVNAIDALTINEENILKKENQELKIDLEQKYDRLEQHNQLLTSKVQEYEGYIKKYDELEVMLKEAVSTIK
jgi:hypothetical protein